MEEEVSNSNNEKSSQESPRPLLSPSCLIESKCTYAMGQMISVYLLLSVQVFPLLVFLVEVPLGLVNVPLVKYP